TAKILWSADCKSQPCEGGFCTGIRTAQIAASGTLPPLAMTRTVMQNPPSQGWDLQSREKRSSKLRAGFCLARPGLRLPCSDFFGAGGGGLEVSELRTRPGKLTRSGETPSKMGKE